MKNQYLEGGKICTAHGVLGMLKVEHLCDDGKILCGVKRVYFKETDGSFTERKVTKASVSGKFVLMGIEGIDSREEAIRYRSRLLYLNRGDVPKKEGAMFLADMQGLPVYHAETLASLGEIKEVSEIAGRRIYVVNCMGREVLVPDVKEFIKEIDEERGMAVLPIPGLFDEADEV